MEGGVLGIHHVTAITADAQKNIDFYCGVLGLRLVKLTVNFDDRGSYHLYYGDETGRPGTAMTFFAWPGATQRRRGVPSATAVAFAVPYGALDYWRERLDDAKLEYLDSTRMGEKLIKLSDPDEINIELIERAGVEGLTEMRNGPIPVEYAISGFHSVTMTLKNRDDSALLLTSIMGMKGDGSENGVQRYSVPGGRVGAIIDLAEDTELRRVSMGAGTVHHVAFRLKSSDEQESWREKLIGQGFNVSPVMERIYFRSIYFREPGGILFEFATDGPGFTADQSVGELGQKLMLPPWIEPHRAEIERTLPEVKLPPWGKVTHPA